MIFNIFILKIFENFNRTNISEVKSRNFSLTNTVGTTIRNCQAQINLVTFAVRPRIPSRGDTAEFRSGVPLAILYNLAVIGLTGLTGIS